MAKGVTNQPLVIWVWAEWYSRPAMLVLMRAGHGVSRMCPRTEWDPEPDLIIHPAAGWDESLLEPEKKQDGTLYYPYIDAGLAGARARARRRKK